jgi:hypothetical protein
MQIDEAEKQFASLVELVYRQGITVDLERDDKVIARLAPAAPASKLTVGQFDEFLRQLPRLGEDAEAFCEDLKAIRCDLLN